MLYKIVKLVERIFKNILIKITDKYNYYHPASVKYRKSQEENYNIFRRTFPDKIFFKYIINRSGAGKSHMAELAQFNFASNELFALKPKNILDIGSHLSWLSGVGSHYNLKTIDIRKKDIVLNAEESFIGRAEKLPFNNESIECITSLCSIEHFGLGSYGDEIDPYGDVKAIAEIERVLKRDGSFIFSTTLTRNKSYIVFNTHRVYSVQDIRKMLNKYFKPAKEQFYSMKLEKNISEELVADKIGASEFDIYLGHWKKN
ncbi:MAG: hypothetical protein A2551_04740 [Elusimicrobia bacterium RIFOXYD2_FULL_34_30]|nr:MAG: hypothetical protein A2551_04740 [Elusimicrobia bacterium RIFOXYD2_FULL_34_30]